MGYAFIGIGSIPESEMTGIAVMQAQMRDNYLTADEEASKQQAIREMNDSSSFSPHVVKLWNDLIAQSISESEDKEWIAFLMSQLI